MRKRVRGVLLWVDNWEREGGEGSEEDWSGGEAKTAGGNGLEDAFGDEETE